MRIKNNEERSEWENKLLIFVDRSMCMKFSRTYRSTGGMVQWVKMLAATPDDLSSIA